jgi:hypothetical protein
MISLSDVDNTVIEGELLDFNRTFDNLIAVNVLAKDGSNKIVVVTPDDFRESVLKEDDRDVFDAWWGNVEIAQA